MPDMDHDFAEDLEKGDVIVPVIVSADKREKSNMPISLGKKEVFGNLFSFWNNIVLMLLSHSCYF